MNAKMELEWSPSASFRFRRWSFLGPPEAFQSSAHYGVEFAWCSGGEVDYRIGSKSITLTPGAIVMVPSLAEHANTMRGSIGAHSILLSSDLVRDVAAQLDLRTPSEATLVRSDRLKTLSRWLEEDAIGNASLVTDALSTLVVAETLRAVSRHEESPPSERSDPRVQRAVEYIRAHAPQALSLEAIANEVGMSRFHFCRIFRQAMGKSPYQFVQEERLAQARVAIEAGATVTQAALEHGFTDLSRFARLFARTFGQLPSKASRIRSLRARAVSTTPP